MKSLSWDESLYIFLQTDLDTCEAYVRCTTDFSLICTSISTAIPCNPLTEAEEVACGRVEGTAVVVPNDCQGTRVSNRGSGQLTKIAGVFPAESALNVMISVIKLITLSRIWALYMSVTSSMRKQLMPAANRLLQPASGCERTTGCCDWKSNLVLLAAPWSIPLGFSLAAWDKAVDLCVAIKDSKNRL